MNQTKQTASISRRTLMATGLAATTTGKLTAQGGNPKLGVIGVGQRARRHLRADQELVDVEVVALCDIQADRMRSARNGPAAEAEMYVDYRELLADRNVQAVVIAAPNYLHAKIAIEAMEAGKDVLVEKPIRPHVRPGQGGRRGSAEARPDRGRGYAAALQRPLSAHHRSRSRRWSG